MMVRHGSSATLCFVERSAVGLAVALIGLAAAPAAAGAQSPSPAVIALDRARVRGHLAMVEAELRAADVRGLTRPQRAARAARLDDLHRYWARGEFPHGNPGQPAPFSPTFIDERGRPCAMAALVMASGHEEVAREIARDQNYARVPDIEHPALGPWLRANGLSLEEATRVQPTYCAGDPVCTCYEDCSRAGDAGPPVCAPYDYEAAGTMLEGFGNQCVADCLGAEVTGPAECDEGTLTCSCLDAGPRDGGGADAGMGPAATGPCACRLGPGRTGSPTSWWALVLAVSWIGARPRRRRS